MVVVLQVTRTAVDVDWVVIAAIRRACLSSISRGLYTRTLTGNPCIMHCLALECELFFLETFNGTISTIGQFLICVYFTSGARARRTSFIPGLLKLLMLPIGKHVKLGCKLACEIKCQV